MPYPRDYAAGFCIPGGNIYLGTGSILPSQISWVGFGDLNEYNPVTNRWTKQNLIPEREDAMAFSAGTKGYIGFGYNEDLSSDLYDLWEFDPTTGSWSQKADFPDSTLDVKFSFGVNGNGYVGGAGANDLWEFDAAGNSWTYIDSLPFNGNSITTTFTIGMNAYVLGNNLTWKYDALLMNWTAVAPFPVSNPNAGFELLGMGYASANNHFYQYDPVGNQWTQKTMYSNGYGGNVGGSDSNYGYVLGSDGSVSRYDPNADTWTNLYTYFNYFNITGKLMTLDGLVYSKVSVYDPVADQWTLDTNITNDGWLFAINNFGYAMRNGSFQKYDPLSTTWTPLNAPGFEVGLTFAVNGKGYSVLALDSNQNAIPDLHEYDPVSDSWVLKAPYPGGQAAQTIAFTISDKGYLIGGVDVTWSNTEEFWEYDPVNDQWARKADYPNYYFTYRAFAEEYHGKGYVGLGRTDPTGGADSLIFCYDPLLDTWSQISHPIGPRGGTLYFNANDALYVGRGSVRWSMDYSYSYNNLWAMSDSAFLSSGLPLKNETFQVYPNPANNMLNISSDGIDKIEMFSSTGQKIFSEYISGLKENYQMDISDLPDGIYYLKLLTGEKDLVRKVLIQQ